MSMDIAALLDFKFGFQNFGMVAQKYTTEESPFFQCCPSSGLKRKFDYKIIVEDGRGFC